MPPRVTMTWLWPGDVLLLAGQSLFELLGEQRIRESLADAGREGADLPAACDALVRAAAAADGREEQGAILACVH